MTEFDGGGERAGVFNVCFPMTVRVYTLSLDVQRIPLPWSQKALLSYQGIPCIRKKIHLKN